jgi:hypothetical protein
MQKQGRITASCGQTYAEETLNVLPSEPMPDSSPATFKVLASFTAFGVGYVLVGDALTGEINPGDYLLLPVNGQLQPQTIIEVESVDRVTDGTTHTGLVILYGTEEELRDLKALELTGQVLNIFPA